MSERTNRRRRRTRAEQGYVMAITALMMVPLMVFAAFATDVGAWYVRGQQVQRAADAAALAAVVWMPSLADAETAAIEVAALNGFVDQPGDFDTGPLPQVRVTPLANQQVMVEIKAEGEVYFGSAVGVDGIEITRFAAAEYILPVPMGNPTSAIGAADLDIGGRQNYWLNAHANCFNASAGDLLNSAPGTGGCSPPTNPYYRDRGYIYVIDKPENVAVDVEVLHAGRCKRPGWGDGRGERWTQNTPGLEFTLYRADNTPLADEDNMVPSNQFGTTQTLGAATSTGSNPGSSGPDCPTFTAGGAWDQPNWQGVFSIPANAQAGRWFLTVGTPVGSTGHKNMYGLRVMGSNFTSGAEFCTTLDPTTVTTGTCPTITALDYFSIYIGENRDAPSSAPEAANFFFAEIEEVHAGKVMQVNLWDPAEGSEYLQFMDPYGNPAAFRYRTENLNGSGQTGWTNITGCTIGGVTGPCLPTPGSGGYHNKFLTIEVDLGQTYTCNAGDCWWKVRYASTSSVDDTTTWSVRIVGDPVRLIE